MLFAGGGHYLIKLSMALLPFTNKSTLTFPEPYWTYTPLAGLLVVIGEALELFIKATVCNI